MQPTKPTAVNWLGTHLGNMTVSERTPVTEYDLFKPMYDEVVRASAILLQLIRAQQYYLLDAVTTTVKWS